MSDIAGLAIGLVLGLWSTQRLEHDVAALVHARSLSHRPACGSLRVHGAAPLENSRCAARNLAWLFGHWTVRYAPIVTAFWVMVAWSASAPLAGLGGFWLGRTSYLVAALLKSRRFA